MVISYNLLGQDSKPLGYANTAIGWPKLDTSDYNSTGIGTDYISYIKIDSGAYNPEWGIDPNFQLKGEKQSISLGYHKNFIDSLGEAWDYPKYYKKTLVGQKESMIGDLKIYYSDYPTYEKYDTVPVYLQVSNIKDAKDYDVKNIGVYCIEGYEVSNIEDFMDMNFNYHHKYLDENKKEIQKDIIIWQIIRK